MVFHFYTEFLKNNYHKSDSSSEFPNHRFHFCFHSGHFSPVSARKAGHKKTRRPLRCCHAPPASSSLAAVCVAGILIALDLAVEAKFNEDASIPFLHKVHLRFAGSGFRNIHSVVQAMAKSRVTRPLPHTNTGPTGRLQLPIHLQKHELGFSEQNPQNLNTAMG